MRELILKHALKNAIDHGTATGKSVASKVFGEDPTLRKNAKQAILEIEAIVKEVNALSKEEQVGKLEKLWPEALEKKEKVVEKKGLKDLPNVKGKVIVRFAPNPNGPPTLGHARGIVINAEYAKKYDGTFILRFDDTDPVTKRPMEEAYAWFEEDMTWLGCKPDKIIRASERMEVYYDAVDKLIEKNALYLCVCAAEDFRKLKAAGKECNCRPQDSGTTKDHWAKMKNGEYDEGQAVLRIRTDIKHKDPALRDWVCFRVIKTAHPIVGDKYKAWPMLDFESAIEDHEQGVTHIIRGKDLRDSTEKQKYLYNYLGWDYPETLYWGIIAIHEFGKFSTSQMKKDIADEKYIGWDDPRLPTLRALKRRGYDPAAIRNFYLDFGLTQKDISASLQNLESFNKTEVDAKAKRIFFVPNPKSVTVTGIPSTTVELKNHPQNSSMGTRSYNFEGEQTFFIPEEDYSDDFRLKDAFNVRNDSYDGTEIRKNQKVQWVVDGVPVEVVMPDGSVMEGVAEACILDEPVGAEFMFERFGYVRLDGKEDGIVGCWFTHK